MWNVKDWDKSILETVFLNKSCTVSVDENGKDFLQEKCGMGRCVYR